MRAVGEQGVAGSSLRLVDHDVKPGVLADMGDGDQWPGIRERVLAADILVPEGHGVTPCTRRLTEALSSR